ncbi:hypothetical protein QTP86_018902 [Hemibagrus guttatus]|nr:hypothetical protein QTP86_018902 [Hemibagrus guttatus]
MVLSQFIFTLYTSDFSYNTNPQARAQERTRLIIKDFVDWCECNHLHLNTSKTKEMVIDFRRRTPHHTYQ